MHAECACGFRPPRPCMIALDHRRLVASNEKRSGEGIIMRVGLAAFAVSALVAGSAAAQISGDVVKIAVMNDMSGPFEDVTGAGGLLAAKMAAEDFGGMVKGAKIEVIGGDHQNKPDIASALARRWY